MGGMLSFLLAAQRPDRIKATVPFYGFPQGDSNPTGRRSPASIRGHMAENDDFFGPDAARELEASLQALGKDVTLTVHPGTGHAFMAPHNALGTQDEARVAADLARGRGLPARATRLSEPFRCVVSMPCSSTRVGCWCSPIRRCSARCSPTTAAMARSRPTAAHYAGMAAKSTAGAMEADWVTYDEAYVRAVGVHEADVAEATTLLGQTRHAPLWRWAIPESRAALDRLAAAGVPMGVVSNASGQIEGVLAARSARSATARTWRCGAWSTVMSSASPSRTRRSSITRCRTSPNSSVRGSPTSVIRSRWTSGQHTPPGCTPSSSIPTTTTPVLRSSASDPSDPDIELADERRAVVSVRQRR